MIQIAESERDRLQAQSEQGGNSADIEVLLYPHLLFNLQIFIDIFFFYPFKNMQSQLNELNDRYNEVICGVIPIEFSHHSRYFILKLRDENTMLRQELDAFDPSFFEEIEDLKVCVCFFRIFSNDDQLSLLFVLPLTMFQFNYRQAVERIEWYENELQRIQREYSVPIET